MEIDQRSEHSRRRIRTRPSDHRRARPGRTDPGSSAHRKPDRTGRGRAEPRDSTAAWQSEGIRAIYGDATHRETLEQAGSRGAVSLVLSSTKMDRSAETIRLARQLNPTILIVARSTYLRELPAPRRGGRYRLLRRGRSGPGHDRVPAPATGSHRRPDRPRTRTDPVGSLRRPCRRSRGKPLKTILATD